MTVSNLVDAYRGSTRAVLTGDLVGSSELTVASLEAARTTLLSALDDIAGWQNGLVASQPEFFRGDSWQALLTHPHFCLRSFVYIRAKLLGSAKGWDSRIAIGLGLVSRVDKKRTSLSAGEAFNLSGRALDAMSSGGRVAISAPPNLILNTAALDPLAQICSGLIDDWSQTQAQITALALPPKPPTHREIAEQLGVTQQSVSKTLAAAKLPLLMQAIAYCERLTWKVTTRIL